MLEQAPNGPVSSKEVEVPLDQTLSQPVHETLLQPSDAGAVKRIVQRITDHMAHLGVGVAAQGSERPVPIQSTFSLPRMHKTKKKELMAKTDLADPCAEIQAALHPLLHDAVHCKSPGEYLSQESYDCLREQKKQELQKVKEHAPLWLSALLDARMVAAVMPESLSDAAAISVMLSRKPDLADQ